MSGTAAEKYGEKSEVKDLKVGFFLQKYRKKSVCTIKKP